MAYTDYLTKLCNRYSCDKELQQLIEEAQQVGKNGYLFIDLDNFKIVNDCYGHDYGDAILFSFASWLSETFTPKSKRSAYWHCVCDCGKVVEVTADRLLYGSYRSCGCLKWDNQQAIFEKLHMVDGTCIEWLERRTMRVDNTSGYRGVYRMKNGKYRVSIGFKGQRFHLGTYVLYDDAVDTRIKAEKLLHEGFVKAYYQWKEKADQDPEWNRLNPFGLFYKKKEDGYYISIICTAGD